MFGFDLMVDDNNKVWLIEVNSSPAVADELNTKLAADLVAKEIDPYFEVAGPCAAGAAATTAAGLEGNGWETIFDART